MLLQGDQEQPSESRHDRRQEANFHQNYKELLAGVNRIRYLKKKQMHNHQIMTQHFTNLLRRIEKQKQPKPERVKAALQLPKTHSEQNTKLSRFRYIFAEESPYKPKNAKWPPIARNQTTRNCRSGYLIQDRSQHDKQNGSKLFEDKPTDATLTDFNSLRGETSCKRQQIREIMKKKQENYQQMRQMRLKIEKQSQQQRQQHLSAARQSKLKVELSRQEGRRRLQEHYHRHLENIKAQKEAERDKKNEINRQRYLQILEMQKQEQEELDIYEQSLIMEEQLKSYIEQTSAQGLLLFEPKTTEETTLI